MHKLKGCATRCLKAPLIREPHQGQQRDYSGVDQAGDHEDLERAGSPAAKALAAPPVPTGVWEPVHGGVQRRKRKIPKAYTPRLEPCRSLSYPVSIYASYWMRLPL